MGYTIAEKILMLKSGRQNLMPGDIVTIEPDMVMSHDNTAFITKKFYETGVRRVWDRGRIVIVFDHCVPAEKPEHRKNHTEAEQFAREQQIKNFIGFDGGVSHQVMCERGFVLPGEIIMGSDSHSTLYGAFGALGIPINRTEMAGIWATGKTWLKVPETIKIVVEGRFPRGVYAKDLIMKLLSILRADGAQYKSIEFTGSTIEEMSISSRMTLSNMAVELGAKAGIVPFDRITEEYLKGRVQKNYVPVYADSDAKYEKTVYINAGMLEPQVACPHTVDNVRPVSEAEGTSINMAYLGSCTNGRIEDLQTAAEILKGRKVAEGVRLVVYPASTEVDREARRLGIYDALTGAGAQWMTASCGPCFGDVGATLKDGEVCISSSNRNFCGRMGSKKSFVYLASPATVAASCIGGKIVAPGRYIDISAGKVK